MVFREGNTIVQSGQTFGLGTHTITARATDAHGNTASENFTIIVVDTTPPTLTTVANQTDEATGPTGAAAAFSASATDIVDGTDAVVFKEGSTIVQSGQTFSVGTHTITASATDAASNTASQTFTIKVQDTTPPSLTPIANQTDEATGPNGAAAMFSATATDIVDGIDPVVFTEGNIIVQSGQTFGLGTHTITASATDVAGNMSSETSAITVRDTTPPDTSILTEPPAQTSSSTAAFTVKGADAVGVVGFKYALDNAASWTSTTSTSISFTGLAAGAHTFQVAAFDAAGNVDPTPASYAWTVQSRPTVVSLSSSQGVFQQGRVVAITLTLSAAVAVSGGTLILALNDGGTATYDPAHSTATSLVFDYTVGTNDPATSSLAITRINLNGATIKDAGGNAADLSAAQAALPGTYINLNLNNNSTIVLGANATITLGNGSDTVTAGANCTVSLGNGNDTVTVGNNSTVTLGNGNDTVTAGSSSNIKVGNGNDTIYAGANDIINLGHGQDTVGFGLPPNAGTIGHETVGGFDSSKDVILFNPALFVNFAAVMSDAKQAGHDTVITRDTNDSVTLQGVALSSLTASNFHFA
jgi:hypothetical protein